MRLLKFRAFDNLGKILSYNPTMVLLNGKLWAANVEDINIDSNDWLLSQSTGLKDKHGEEIYEGDIVQYYLGTIDDNDLDIGTVFFDSQNSALGIIWEGCGVQFFREIDLTCVKVIGNIYEHPGLLNEEY